MKDYFQFHIKIYNKQNNDLAQSINDINQEFSPYCCIQQQQEIIIYIQNIIKQTNIQASFYKENCYSNGRCIISFHDLEINHLVLEDNYWTFADFHNCKIGRINFTDDMLKVHQEYNFAPYQRFNLKFSNIEILDFSNNCFSMFNKKDYQQILLFSTPQNRKIESLNQTNFTEIKLYQLLIDNYFFLPMIYCRCEKIQSKYILQIQQITVANQNMFAQSIYRKIL